MIQSSRNKTLLLTFRPQSLIRTMTSEKMVVHHEKSNVGQFPWRVRGSGGVVSQIAIASVLTERRSSRVSGGAYSTSPVCRCFKARNQDAAVAYCAGMI